MSTSIMGYYDDDESETGLPILPINGRMPIPASAATNDYDDNETGLPPIANNNRNNHHIMDNFDEEITGFENANMRNRQQPPQPDARNSSGSSPPPSDPEPPVPNFYQQRKQEPKKTNIKDFTEELIFTLASKFTGYKEINELKADLHKDSGYQPDWVALEFGFPNFDTFIKSEGMKKYVKMATINGEIYYMPKDFSRFEHIRKEQEITQNADILSIEKDEQEKLVRALLPENRAAALEGRKRISEILYELGGDKKQILWVDIQKKYREKYDVDLAGAELKRFFQRDKALAIVQSIFNKEVQLFDSNTAGHFFLKLKIPYPELIEYYEEQMHSQSEATRKLEEIRRGNKTYHHYPPAPGPGKHRKEIIPTEPYLPEPSPETTAFLSERPSTSAAAGISFGGRPPQSAPIMTNATKNNGIARSKFDLSPEDMAVKPRANNFDKVLTNSGNVQEEGDGAIRWADNDILPAYQVGQDNSQPPVVRSNNNENGADGNEVQKKKKKYTDAHNDAEMTDSDESAGSDDEGTLVNGHSGQPTKSLVNPNANNAKTISALPPVRLSTHQKSILGYMEQKTAEKKAAAGAGTNKPHSHPQQQQLNTTSTGGGIGTNNRYNQSAVGQNLNISESEDDGENEAPIRPQQQSQPQHSLASISAPSVAAAINTNRQQHQPQPATLLQQHQQSTVINSIAATPTPYVPMPTASVPPSPFVGNLNASMPQYNQYPSPMTPTMANGGGQQYQQQLLSPPTHGNWKLMDQTESLRALASVKQLSTESRMDEGSFAFRNTALILMLTECGDEIRASSHVNGAIIGERRYPKVDWDMFKQTIRGLIEETFFATTNSIRR